MINEFGLEEEYGSITGFGAGDEPDYYSDEAAKLREMEQDAIINKIKRDNDIDDKGLDSIPE